MLPYASKLSDKEAVELLILRYSYTVYRHAISKHTSLLILMRLIGRRDVGQAQASNDFSTGFSSLRRLTTMDFDEDADLRLLWR
jgi:hypothetical protein